MGAQPEAVQGWLDAYLAAWKSYDPSAIRALFTDDATYRYKPWEDPLNGIDEILASWLVDPDPANSWQAWYRVDLVDGDRATAVGETRYTDETNFANLWVMQFAHDGRCSQFTEWYMEIPVAEAPEGPDE